jgi:hypothetical protein
MANFILILLCLGGGFLVARTGLMPKDGFKAINVWVVYFGVPALIIRYMPTVEWSLGMLAPCIGPMLVWAGAYLYISAYSKVRAVDKETRTAMMMGCGLGNTAFFGYPMVMAFYGKEAMSVAVVFDVTSLIIFCTLGTLTVLKAANPAGSIDYKQLARKMFTMPPFVTILLVLMLQPVFDFSVLSPVTEVLAPTVVPLSLFSIGLQLTLKNMDENARHMAVGLVYKLLLAPFIVLVLALILGAKGNVGMVSVFMAATPPHIMASLLAGQFGMNPKLGSLMVSFGIVGALILMPLYSLLLPRLF